MEKNCLESTAAPDFDVIIVGAGVAGCVAAIELAKQDYSVALIERGETPGAKNLSGGIFYTRVMEEVIPDFLRTAPLERAITTNNLSFLNKESAVTISYQDTRLQDPVNAVSVLRAKLDSWLAEQAEEAGVLVMPGVKVDELLMEEGQICGIRAGDEEMRAHITILADGVNSFLATAAGIRSKAPNSALALGIKSVIEIGEKAIEERFHLDSTATTSGLPNGAAFSFLGDATCGGAGGGFLYTNKESLSLGVVLRLDDLVKKELSAPDIHDYFFNHPVLAPYIKDGKVLEYGCHLTIEDAPSLTAQKLYAPGLLIIGDAAGFTLNTGIAIRGMDLAAESARCAAQAAHTALVKEDFSAASLRSYQNFIDESWLGKDLATYRRAPQFFENERLYRDYGKFLGDTFFDLYSLDLQPHRPLRQVVMNNLQKSGIKMTTLIKDAFRAGRAL